MRRLWHAIVGHPADQVEWAADAGGMACLKCRTGLGQVRPSRVRAVRDGG